MTLRPAAVSPNLALDQEVARRRAAGAPVVHLGFGEARVPLHEGLTRALLDGAGRTAYGPVAGDPGALRAVAGYHARRRLPTEPGQVVLAPGSKPLLMALVAAVEGDVLLPCPAWVTYAPQARLLGRRATAVAVPAECGGVPDPDALARAVRAERKAGRRPRLLVLTLPDNPTGTLAPPSLVRRVCAVAREEDLIVVSDEIYRDLLHDPATPFLSPAEAAPERTVVTTGLSKTHALGGWRIGTARFPAGDLGTALRDRVLATASEVWSGLAGPMRAVADYAFGEPPDLAGHVRAGARLHAGVTRAVHRVVVAAGADCRPPAGGFYVYPDFEPVREALAGHGAVDSASLERVLLERHGVAVLGGHHFGDDPRALRFRAATSLLHGATDQQRRTALDSADPAGLPHVARELDRLAEALAKLTA
ncbi:pyridoxal phosphate-dependent aminotransferase [Streptomyces sp. NBC_01803]|uniref:pyridoxal phosphate-dependent aminotransferase n=1 Tax=Streptomyces sp. NBC_01803 TaxID=2975946 RepID=UPI002DDC0973|nr:pyridoxal phosphate-dependent aminotransferase [Streptomyces sp. NBC_01803]WSA43090.1 pyridoxal phosphate-dependent aminotransferase [Streptomyces sp. NBC_01803]